AALDLLDQRVEGAVQAVRRALEEEGDVVPLANSRPEGLNHARLADPWVAGQEHGLAFATADEIPSAKENLELLITGDEGRQRGGSHGFKAACSMAVPQDTPDRYRTPRAGERLGAQVLVNECPRGQFAGIRTDRHRSRFGQGLDARREIGRLAYDRTLLR